MNSKILINKWAAISLTFLIFPVLGCRTQSVTRTTDSYGNPVIKEYDSEVGTRTTTYHTDSMGQAHAHTEFVPVKKKEEKKCEEDKDSKDKCDKTPAGMKRHIQKLDRDGGGDLITLEPGTKGTLEIGSYTIEAGPSLPRVLFKKSDGKKVPLTLHLKSIDSDTNTAHYRLEESVLSPISNRLDPRERIREQNQERSEASVIAHVNVENFPSGQARQATLCAQSIQDQSLRVCASGILIANGAGQTGVTAINHKQFQNLGKEFSSSPNPITVTLKIDGVADPLSGTLEYAHFSGSKNGVDGEALTRFELPAEVGAALESAHLQSLASAEPNSEAKIFQNRSKNALAVASPDTEQANQPAALTGTAF